jgi:hypothetical protein
MTRALVEDPGEMCGVVDVGFRGKAECLEIGLGGESFQVALRRAGWQNLLDPGETMIEIFETFFDVSAPTRPAYVFNLSVLRTVV